MKSDTALKRVNTVLLLQLYYLINHVNYSLKQNETTIVQNSKNKPSQNWLPVTLITWCCKCKFKPFLLKLICDRSTLTLEPVLLELCLNIQDIFLLLSYFIWKTHNTLFIKSQSFGSKLFHYVSVMLTFSFLCCICKYHNLLRIR